MPMVIAICSLRSNAPVIVGKLSSAVCPLTLASWVTGDRSASSTTSGEEPAADRADDDAGGGEEEPLAQLDEVLPERHAAFGVGLLAPLPLRSPARGRRSHVLDLTGSGPTVRRGSARSRGGWAGRAGAGVPGEIGHTWRDRAYRVGSTHQVRGTTRYPKCTMRGRAYPAESGVPGEIGHTWRDRAYLVGSTQQVRPERPGTGGQPCGIGRTSRDRAYLVRATHQGRPERPGARSPPCMIGRTWSERAALEQAAAADLSPRRGPRPRSRARRHGPRADRAPRHDRATRRRA